jgi:small multidrug resistance pump
MTKFYNNIWILLLIVVILEAISLSLLAAGVKYSNSVYIFGIIGYCIAGYIFYLILKTKKPLSKANALWNVGSIVLITLLSVIIFKEKIDIYQAIGLLFAFMSVVFIEYEGLYSIYKNYIR